MSDTGRSNSSEMYQAPLKRAVSQARGRGQDTCDVLAFPVIEVIDQQDTRVRHYQTLDFKLIKELKTAVVQYGRPFSPFHSSITGYSHGVTLNPPRWENSL